MPKDSDLQGIFNEILEGKKKKVLFIHARHYDSTRSNLLRKFRTYLALLESLGGPNFLEEKFLKCSWNGEEVSGTFYLEEKTKRTNVPGKVYNTIDI